MRRVLSIDGGGIKGMVPAAFLAEVEDAIGCSVTKYFDLIVGTSTGGIIALGLGLGMSAAEIRTFYEELGPRVFSANVFTKIRQYVRPRYSSEPLRMALKEAFGDLKLADSKVRLVIPAFNVDTGKVHVYKTAHHVRFERDHKEFAVDVALATAAAPAYFPAHRSAHGIPLVDGGVWANNPVAVAVVEAMGVLNWQSEDVRVVSLGCVDEPISARRHVKDGRGRLYWAIKAVDVFMAGQSSGALGMARLLAGHSNVHRFAPVIERGRFSLDATGEISSLRGLGAEEARHALPKLREAFFHEKAQPFTPLHTL